MSEMPKLRIKQTLHRLLIIYVLPGSYQKIPTAVSPVSEGEIKDNPRRNKFRLFICKPISLNMLSGFLPPEKIRGIRNIRRE